VLNIELAYFSLDYSKVLNKLKKYIILEIILYLILLRNEDICYSEKRPKEERKIPFLYFMNLYAL